MAYSLYEEVVLLECVVSFLERSSISYLVAAVGHCATSDVYCVGHQLWICVPYVPLAVFSVVMESAVPVGCMRCHHPSILARRIPYLASVIDHCSSLSCLLSLFVWLMLIICARYCLWIIVPAIESIDINLFVIISNCLSMIPIWKHVYMCVRVYLRVCVCVCVCAPTCAILVCRLL